MVLKVAIGLNFVLVSAAVAQPSGAGETASPRATATSVASPDAHSQVDGNMDGSGDLASSRPEASVDPLTTPDFDRYRESVLSGDSYGERRLPPPGVSGLVLIGVGAGALIAAIGTGVSTLRLQSELRRDCPDTQCDGPNPSIDRKNALELSTNILLIYGGTVTTAGLSLLIVALVNKKRRTQSAYAPTITPYGLGVRF